MKCEVKGCENKALVRYGNYWICGDCYMKILKKENEAKNKQVEELEI